MLKIKCSICNKNFTKETATSEQLWGTVTDEETGKIFTVRLCKECKDKLYSLLKA